MAALQPDFAECVLWLTRASHNQLAQDHWEASSHFQVVDERHVEHIVTTPPEPMAELGGVATLPQVDASWVPLLHLRHGRDDHHEVLTLTLILTRVHGGKPVFAGWRYEAPEGPGDHCFWHAQPVRDPRVAVPDIEDHGPPAWFPDWGPTMPLRAKDPLGLLLCMLVSVYGRNRFDEMQQDGFDDQLGERLREFDDIAV